MVFLIIIILTILNAYFSLAEIALVAVNHPQLKAEAEKKNKKAVQALSLTEQPEEFLGAVQVGITLLGLLEGIYGGGLVAEKLQAAFAHWGLSSWLAHALSLVIGIGIITYLTIVIGELVPKSIAMQAPLKTALAVAPSLALFTRIAYPFIKLLTVSTRLLLKWMGIKTEQKEAITEQDVKRMLSTAHQQGVLDKSELWLHENIFTFGELTAGRMMKPAAVARCVDYDWSRKRTEEEIGRYPYTYFPVYRKHIENVVGVINVKRFFLYQGENWQAVMENDVMVDAATKATDIFNRFKDSHFHFGVVVDAQKKFIGIVTMQDVMEGVFGDIPELENFKEYFYQRPDGSWKASGFIHLQRVRRTLGLDWLRTYEQKYINLDELMKGELGHLPNRNEAFAAQNVLFVVEDVNDGRVKTIGIRKNQ